MHHTHPLLDKTLSAQATRNMMSYRNGRKSTAGASRELLKRLLDDTEPARANALSTGTYTNTQGDNDLPSNRAEGAGAEDFENPPGPTDPEHCDVWAATDYALCCTEATRRVMAHKPVSVTERTRWRFRARSNTQTKLSTVLIQPEGTCPVVKSTERDYKSGPLPRDYSCCCSWRGGVQRRSLAGSGQP